MSPNSETEGLRPSGLESHYHAVGFFSDVAMTLEKARVATQVRLAHLGRLEQTDPDTEELLRRAKPLEDFVDGKLGEWVLQHPTAKWWRRISGMPVQVMGKVIGCIEQFGKFYPAADPMIPHYVQRAPETDDEGKKWVWVDGIERLVTPAKLNKYAGFVPGQRPTPGQLLDYNKEFKTILFRLCKYGFIMHKNRYYDQYLLYKSYKLKVFDNNDILVRPTPLGRYCRACDKTYTVKAAMYCPVCNEKLSKKEEPPGVIWQGHLDMMARRRAIKLFLDHLWRIWRTDRGLPVREPWAVKYTEHETIIEPWDMCDLDEGQALAATA